MRTKIIRIFLYSAAVMLLVTAMAKLISSFGSDRFVERHDPLFQISYRNLFWIVGTLEVGVSLYCFFGKQLVLRTGLVAWLATCFLIYHICMPRVGYHKPCPCLGNLTGAIRVSPQMAEAAMSIILSYLLVGSYATLFWLWRQRRKGEVRMQNDEINPEMEVG